MKIANIMTRDAHFIGPDMTLREAACFAAEACPSPRVKS